MGVRARVRVSRRVGFSPGSCLPPDASPVLAGWARLRRPPLPLPGDTRLPLQRGGGEQAAGGQGARGGGIRKPKPAGHGEPVGLQEVGGGGCGKFGGGGNNVWQGWASPGLVLVFTRLLVLDCGAPACTLPCPSRASQQAPHRFLPCSHFAILCAPPLVSVGWPSSRWATQFLPPCGGHRCLASAEVDVPP